MGELNEKLDNIMKELAELKGDKKAKKEKLFKLPFRAKLSKKKVADGWVTVVGINNNRELAFTRKPVIEGVYEWNGVPHIATADYVLTYKGKPAVIQPEWSLKPISPADNYAETEKEQLRSAGYKLVLNYLEKKEIDAKKMSGGVIWWIIGGLAVVVGLYYLFKGGF